MFREVFNRIILITTLFELLIVLHEIDAGFCPGFPFRPCPPRKGFEKGEPPRTYPNFNWSIDPACKNFQIELAPPTTFLKRPEVGYPGTGSEWLLDFITAASGYYSGLIKYDYLEVHAIKNVSATDPNWQNLRAKPRFWIVTDPENGRTLLQFSYYNGYNLINHKKSFRYSKKMLKSFGGILFIRNPWDSFTSLKRATDMMAGDKKQELSSEAMNFARGWVKLAKTWISNSAPNDLLVVQYEKVLENPRAELVRIMEYLQIPVSQERLDCIEKYPLANYEEELKEKVKTDSIRSSFYGLDEVNQFLQQSIKDLNNELGDRGTVLDYAGPTTFHLHKRSEEEL